jgi:hypothetical protein
MRIDPFIGGEPSNNEQEECDSKERSQKVDPYLGAKTEKLFD